MNRKLKAVLVIVGAIVCSTIAINASDILNGIDGNMSGLVLESTGPCGSYAVLHNLRDGSVCIDTMEASPGDSCVVAAPQSILDTQKNVSENTCAAASQPDVQPWRFVSLTQAQQLCARAGKRLLTSEEWYQVTLSLANPDACVINQQDQTPMNTGQADCVTPTGIHDLVGNVWEWTDTTMVDGKIGEYTLPESGYVALMSPEGVVLETAESPNDAFGSDYAWTNTSGVRGIIRGGFYNSKSDAGIFALNAAVALDFAAAGVGFRCAKDL